MASDFPQNLELDVRKLVADILEIEEQKITPDMRFVEDLGMDSMMALEILASAEKKYKIKISEDYLPKVTTLQSMIDIIKELISSAK
jgi:acyl carrier protein